MCDHDCGIAIPCSSWWRHQMETHSALLALYAGIHRSTAISPHEGQWRGALMFSLICAWINGSANTRDAGDLRRHGAHNGVIVMCVYLICVWGLGLRVSVVVALILDKALASGGEYWIFILMIIIRWIMFNILWAFHMEAIELFSKQWVHH